MNEILKYLEFFRDNIRQGKMSMNDIPDDLLEKLLNVIFEDGQDTDADFVAGAKQCYFLARQCGNSEQQSAYFEMLRGILSMKVKAESDINDAISKHQKSIGIMGKYVEQGLTEQYIDTHTWGDVASLKDGENVDLFWKLSEEVRTSNIKRIQKKDKIKVAFFVKDSAEWSVESLYRKLLQDERYEVYVLVAPFGVGTEITVIDTYNKAVEYFENKGYQVYGMAEFDGYCIKRYKTWGELPVSDVLFLLNPHIDSYCESCNAKNFPLKTLIAYMPYGYSIYGDVEHQYNQLSHNLCWKIFYESESDMEICRKYCDLGDRNALMSGYPKMDPFYDEKVPDAGEIWKIPEGKTNVKKIIYAPHWSIREGITGFGNFDKIYDWIYEYAKNHTDTTSWIFRPHPMLRAGTVEFGVFKTENDFDNYMKKWDELPNARVIERGEYIDVLKTSDAMVLDSISFLAEYQFTNKPLLFLTREANTWNDFGKEIAKILYTAPGDDTDAIERFVEDVVINGNDPMKQERQAFFKKYLDYKTINGKLAGDYIKDFLDETFDNKKE